MKREEEKPSCCSCFCLLFCIYSLLSCPSISTWFYGWWWRTMLFLFFSLKIMVCVCVCFHCCFLLHSSYLLLTFSLFVLHICKKVKYNMLSVQQLYRKRHEFITFASVLLSVMFSPLENTYGETGETNSCFQLDMNMNLWRVFQLLSLLPVYFQFHKIIMYFRGRSFTPYLLL